MIMIMYPVPKKLYLSYVRRLPCLSWFLIFRGFFSLDGVLLSLPKGLISSFRFVPACGSSHFVPFRLMLSHATLPHSSALYCIFFCALQIKRFTNLKKSIGLYSCTRLWAGMTYGKSTATSDALLPHSRVAPGRKKPLPPHGMPTRCAAGALRYATGFVPCHLRELTPYLTVEF